jgi:hypothetical protein
MGYKSIKFLIKSTFSVVIVLVLMFVYEIGNLIIEKSGVFTKFLRDQTKNGPYQFECG